MDRHLDEGEEKSTRLLQGKSVLGRGSRRCKGPEVAARLACWENHRGAVGLEHREGRLWEEER